MNIYIYKYVYLYASLYVYVYLSEQIDYTPKVSVKVLEAIWAELTTFVGASSEWLA